MAQYRKKPIVVEAFRYEGPSPEFSAWHDEYGGWGGIEPVGINREQWCEPDWPLRLRTAQGEWVTCRKGEVIIAEPVQGRFYPCAGDLFDAMFEAVAT